MNIPGFLKSQKKLSGHHLSLAIGLGLASGFLLILQAWLLANIINDVVFDKATLESVYPWLFAMLGVFTLRAFLNWASEVTAFNAAAEVKRNLRQQLQTKLFALGPIANDGERSGELINVLVEGVEALEAYYARYLPSMSLVVLIPLSILVFVFPIDWISGLVLLFTAPLIPFFMILIGKGTERLNKKQWRKMARMSAHFLDMLQGLSTLKIFNASKREADTIARISTEYRQSTMSVLRVAFLSSLALEFLASISIAIVAVLIGFRLLYGEIDFFFGFFALLLAPEFYLPLRNMGTHYHARLEAIGAAEKMLDILEKPTTIQSPQQSGSSRQQIVSNQDINISFHDVSFSYDERGQALAPLNLNIPMGSHIALVGKSGAGKSTILRLLAGFIRPSSGEIQINGQVLDNIKLEDWRQNLAWLPQTPHLFNASIHDNIALGMSSARDTEIIAAAKQANIDSYIEGLTDGYNTLLGERGQGLSGGQIQRIALARAFLKDAPIILLDEATANLDEENERFVQQGIAELGKGKNKTIISIAHRLDTIQSADQIIVMDAGHVVQIGKHEKLLEQTGLYRDLIDNKNDVSI